MSVNPCHNYGRDWPTRCGWSKWYCQSTCTYVYEYVPVSQNTWQSKHCVGQHEALQKLASCHLGENHLANRHLAYAMLCRHISSMRLCKKIGLLSFGQKKFGPLTFSLHNVLLTHLFVCAWLTLCKNRPHVFWLKTIWPTDIWPTQYFLLNLPTCLFVCQSMMNSCHGFWSNAIWPINILSNNLFMLTCWLVYLCDQHWWFLNNRCHDLWLKTILGKCH